MKNILVFSCLLLLSSCAKKIYSPNIENDSTTEEGTIRIHTDGIGKNKILAYNNSIEKAFSRLLYQGIPESVQSTPLIPDEAAARQQHSAALDCFQDAKCYSQFLTKASQQNEKERVEGGYEVRSDVTINMRALRAYLEKNNVIRKFGF